MKKLYSSNIAMVVAIIVIVFSPAYSYATDSQTASKQLDLAAITHDCDSGNFEACVNGYSYCTKIDSDNCDNFTKKLASIDKGVEFLNSKCLSSNDGKYCFMLGDMYYNGIGVGQNYASAASLYQKSCDEGNGNGCENLGYLYYRGWGVSQDYAKTVLLYQKSCDMGNGNGCEHLGYLYESGEGVTKNYLKATSLYQKACDLNNSNGCIDLGTMYHKGEGEIQDDIKAAPLYQKACDMGRGDACIIVNGIKRDLNIKGFNDINEGLKWLKEGFSGQEADEWHTAGFDTPQEASKWKSQGFSSQEAIDWRNAGFNTTQKASKWKNAGLSPKESKKMMRRGLSPRAAKEEIARDIKVRKEKIAENNRKRKEFLHENCPDGVFGPQKFVLTNPYDVNGMCFKLSGQRLQLLNRETALFNLGTYVFYVDFSPKSAPSYFMDRLLKGEDVFKYTATDGSMRTVPALSPVQP